MIKLIHVEIVHIKIKNNAHLAIKVVLCTTEDLEYAKLKVNSIRIFYNDCV